MTSTGGRPQVDYWVNLMEQEGVAGVADRCSQCCERRGGSPLTSDELEERRICRWLFGEYNPSSRTQQRVIETIRAAQQEF